MLRHAALYSHWLSNIATGARSLRLACPARGPRWRRELRELVVAKVGDSAGACGARLSGGCEQLEQLAAARDDAPSGAREAPRDIKRRRQSELLRLPRPGRNDACRPVDIARLILRRVGRPEDERGRPGTPHAADARVVLRDGDAVSDGATRRRQLGRGRPSRLPAEVDALERRAGAVEGAQYEVRARSPVSALTHQRQRVAGTSGRLQQASARRWVCVARGAVARRLEYTCALLRSA